MIAHLKGSVIGKGASYLVIETGGVGYKVFVPASTALEARINIGLSFHIHTHVREDQISLYGFLSKSELDLFDLLLTVSGVGPKVALAVLSAATAEAVASAIEGGDAGVFTKVAGVGKKTAERIIIELKEKLGASNISTSKVFSDSLDALVSLGYSQQEARDALKQLPTSLTDSQSMVREALKLLGKQ